LQEEGVIASKGVLVGRRGYCFSSVLKGVLAGRRGEGGSALKGVLVGRRRGSTLKGFLQEEGVVHLLIVDLKLIQVVAVIVDSKLIEVF